MASRLFGVWGKTFFMCVIIRFAENCNWYEKLLFGKGEQMRYKHFFIWSLVEITTMLKSVLMNGPRVSNQTQTAWLGLIYMYQRTTYWWDLVGFLMFHDYCTSSEFNQFLDKTIVTSDSWETETQLQLCVQETPGHDGMDYVQYLDFKSKT